VLRDMHTLAHSDGLIAGLSHVSICAQITKKSYGDKYSILEIIDKGVYQSKKIAVDFYKGIEKITIN